MADVTAATEAATKAAQDYAAVLASDAWKTSSIDAAVTAWQKLGEESFALTNIAANAEEAYASLAKSIGENGLTFDVATEAGRANGDQIQSLYQSLIPALSAAYADAGGSVSSFRNNMEDLRSQTLAKLTESLGGNEEAARAVLDQLHVFDGSTFSSSFEMLGLEDATTKLGLLSGVLSSLPPDVQRQVTLAVLADDPQLALDTIQASVSGAPPPTAALELDTGPAETTAQGFANSEQPPATTDLEANRKPADQTADAFASQKRTADPVKVDANTAAAISTMLLLYVISRTIQPIVTVDANITPALTDLARLALQRPRVPVEAYLADYPTASEIASRIGRPRIPVDIVVGSSIRITGVRD